MSGDPTPQPVDASTMTEKEALRFSIEAEFNTSQLQIEERFRAERTQRETQYYDAIRDAEQKKIDAYVNAGINPDGSIPEEVLPAVEPPPVVTDPVVTDPLSLADVDTQ